LAYLVLKRHDLIRPMITGEKYLPMGTPGPALASPLRAVVVFLIAALAVGAALNVF
jgi:hypothetical protein